MVLDDRRQVFLLAAKRSCEERRNQSNLGMFMNILQPFLGMRRLRKAWKNHRTTDRFGDRRDRLRRRYACGVHSLAKYRLGWLVDLDRPKAQREGCEERCSSNSSSPCHVVRVPDRFDSAVVQVAYMKKIVKKNKVKYQQNNQLHVHIMPRTPGLKKNRKHPNRQAATAKRGS